jgi:hypothetical protein
MIAPVEAKAGYYVDSIGATNPTIASPGTYVPTNGAVIPTPADSCSYCPNFGMVEQLPVLPGWWRASPSIVYRCQIQSYCPGCSNEPVQVDAGYVAPISGMSTQILAGDLNNDLEVSGEELNVTLSNYWANSPWLLLTNVAGLGGTNVTFALSNNLEGNFTVQYTTNLSDWNNLGLATPRYSFVDSNAPAVPLRYYRLRWP